MTNPRSHRKAARASPGAGQARAGAALLDAVEERDLALRAEAGDDAAMERLVTSHLRFVVKIARSYRGWGLPMSDLIQEGTLGLVQAVRRFDPDRGVRLSTYAAWPVRAAIQEAALRSWSVVRLGTSNAQKMLALRLKRMMAGPSYDQRDLPDDIAARMATRFGVTMAEAVAVARRMAGVDRSLDQPAGSAPSALETLRSPAPSPEAAVAAESEQRHLAAALAAALATLSSREQLVIRRRYLAEARATFSAIGAELGVSKDRVRQLEANALTKLRALLATSFARRNP
ncbi:MAG: sigma-70 family RNA polymerase sigma factor [Rhodospirillales bacterium]|jgi:RNA polymerase sigma-32 factor|nr:sigma-70 family RNA polymerase sigma factor [Rhodospirillales bacterium]